VKFHLNDIDSNLQINDSTVLVSRLEKILDDSDSPLSRSACDSYWTKRLGHCLQCVMC